MSFSYSPDLSIALNYVRWRTGDTEEEYREYEDEEIQFFVDQYPQPISMKDQNKVALGLLKKTLYEILTGPSRERSGAFEVYSPSAEALKLAIRELEDEITASRGLAVPSFGGVKKSDYCRTKRDQSLIQPSFSKGMIYGDGPCQCGCGCYNKCCR